MPGCVVLISEADIWQLMLAIPSSLKGGLISTVMIIIGLISTVPIGPISTLNLPVRCEAPGVEASKSLALLARRDLAVGSCAQHTQS